MSYNSMIAPTKYFQGKGLLNEIYDRTCHLGKKYAFLVDDIVYNIIEAKIKKAFEGKDGEYIYIFHGGESTLEEALRIATLLRENEMCIRDRRKTMREFTALAAQHPEIITAKKRYAIIKAGCYMDKAVYTKLVKEINEGLKSEGPST